MPPYSSTLTSSSAISGAPAAAKRPGPVPNGEVVRPAISRQLAQVLDRARTGPLGLDVYAVCDAVPDPRDRRGVRHRLASLLTLIAAAMFADCNTWTQIMAWIAGADVAVLAAAHCRLDTQGRYVVPSKRTFERVSELLDTDTIARLLLRGLALHPGLAGQTPRTCRHRSRRRRPTPPIPQLMLMVMTAVKRPVRGGWYCSPRTAKSHATRSAGAGGDAAAGRAAPVRRNPYTSARTATGPGEASRRAAPHPRAPTTCRWRCTQTAAAARSRSPTAGSDPKPAKAQTCCRC